MTAGIQKNDSYVLTLMLRHQDNMHYLECEVGTISVHLTGSERLMCLKSHSKYAKTPAFNNYTAGIAWWSSG